MYYLPTPPYLLIAIGLFAAFTSGLAFQATLKQKANEIVKSPTSQTLEQIQGLDLSLPFLGMCFGVCLIIATGLETFNISRPVTYLISSATTIAIGALIWWQLGKLLLQIQAAYTKKPGNTQQS